MAKLIQICASENDLFGLDGDGVAYHYNFNTDSWVRLGHGRHDDGVSRLGESGPSAVSPEGSGRRAAG
jgi:hypothetical protein